MGWCLKVEVRLNLGSFLQISQSSPSWLLDSTILGSVGFSQAQFWTHLQLTSPPQLLLFGILVFSIRDKEGSSVVQNKGMLTFYFPLWLSPIPSPSAFGQFQKSALRNPLSGPKATVWLRCLTPQRAEGTAGTPIAFRCLEDPWEACVFTVVDVNTGHYDKKFQFPV